MKTVIRVCGCKNEGQDKLHGKNNRVFNETADKPPKLRCTVCSKEVG